MAGTDGNFIVYVPLGDPNFDYSNADLSAVDPLGDDAEIGSANIDLSNLNSQSPSKAPTISGTCSDDDSDDPDSDDPDCDNLGWIPALGNHRIYVAFRAPAINPATNSINCAHRYHFRTTSEASLESMAIPARRESTQPRTHLLVSPDGGALP